ncbi:MAG: ABC transporter ATP-binding protein [Chloroflexota bacterium]
MNGLTIENISKSFEKLQALASVSFHITEGEIIAVLGPSGCGKSTLLAIIAGLEDPDQGQVLWNDAPIGNIPPHQRGFGLMFQDFALFPHRDVFDNVAFGLQMAHQPKAFIRERVAETLALVGLPGFERRDVNTLSGGEAQRVALARSLAPRPRLLMLDEPLGSLDRNLRERLVIDLRRILRSSRQTALYVTHDQEEAFAIADRLVVMSAVQDRGGTSVEQTGTPQEIYRHPASAYVAHFLGLSNLFPGQLFPERLLTPIGSFPSPLQPERPGAAPSLVPSPQGTRVTALLRPDTVQIASTSTHRDCVAACQLEGILEETNFRGSACRAVINVHSHRLVFDFPSNTQLPAIGQTMALVFDPVEALQVFPPDDLQRMDAAL